MEQQIDLNDTLQNLITLYFNHNNESICEILQIEYNPNYEYSLDENRYRLNNSPINKYYENGMIFHNDENPSINERINIDEETNHLLNTLFLVTTYIIKERDLINLIVKKWTESSILKSKFEIENIFTIGKLTRRQIKIGEKNWNSLIKTCKNNRIPIKDGFKMSIINYFNEININNKEIDNKSMKQNMK